MSREENPCEQLAENTYITKWYSLAFTKKPNGNITGHSGAFHLSLFPLIELSHKILENALQIPDVTTQLIRLSPNDENIKCFYWQITADIPTSYDARINQTALSALCQQT